MIKISPSLLGADFAHLENEVCRLTSAGADFLHWDVMDGLFVPTLSYGPAVIQALRPYTKLPFDVHLMVQDPLRYVKRFADAGANFLSFHAEATNDIGRMIDAIHNVGIKAALAISPATDVSVAERYIPYLDMILIMTVEPGLGGQALLPQTLEKIKYLRTPLDKSDRKVLLEADGGICAGNAPAVVRAGADVLVAGSAILNSDAYDQAIQDIRTAVATATK